MINSQIEPTPGWTDTLAAGGGIVFAVTAGLMHVVYATKSCIIDLIPVDYVSNAIICSAVYAAKLPQPKVVITHSSSSQLNPCYISYLETELNKYGTYHPYYR